MCAVTHIRKGWERIGVSGSKPQGTDKGATEIQSEGKVSCHMPVIPALRKWKRGRAWWCTLLIQHTRQR